MSHYSCIAIELRDGAALVAALKRLGFKGKVEIHPEAQTLFGYKGDARAQKAHIIIRRQHVGPAANDLGFEKVDGKYRVWVSEYDQRQNGYNDAWMGRLQQAYGIERAKREAKKRGYRATERDLGNGRVRLVLSR